MKPGATPRWLKKTLGSSPDLHSTHLVGSIGVVGLERLLALFFEVRKDLFVLPQDGVLLLELHLFFS